jgi:TetR/AcrR family transcriptional regulator, tetracycline repressor protein
MTVNLSAGPPVGRQVRGPGRPPLISREQVLACALEVADHDGLEAVTMRRLGAELGVDPMAVSRKLGGKSALYDGLVEHVLAEVAIPPRTGDWAGDFTALARALRATLLAHPHTVPLLGTHPPVTPGSFQIIEAAVAVLLDAGFGAQDAADGVDCAARLVIGHVLAEAGQPPAGDTDFGDAQHWQAQQALPAARFPGLAAITRAGVQHDPARLFDFALRGLLLALAREFEPMPGAAG